VTKSFRRRARAIRDPARGLCRGTDFPASAVRALGHVATALFLAVIAGFFAEARTSLAQTPSNPPGDLLEFRSSAAIAAE